jgi:hypothetical protein
MEMGLRSEVGDCPIFAWDHWDHVLLAPGWPASGAFRPLVHVHDNDNERNGDSETQVLGRRPDVRTELSQ